MKSVNALLEYMKQHDMDAFFLAKKQNIRYISGYTGRSIKRSDNHLQRSIYQV